MDNERRYKAYLVRLWHTGHADKATWRASIEDAHTGAHYSFASLEILFAFFEAETHAITHLEVHATDQNQSDQQQEDVMATATPNQVDFNAVKQRQHAAWSSGDYSIIGATLVIVAEQLCESVDLRSGQQVLDVATGSGITAIAAARRYCEVTGLDYVPALLDRARERAAAEHLSVTFQEGDAENMPFPDESFDAVLSTFGVMFTPNQEQAARELLRVCRPGGKIGLANWTPDSFVGQLFRTIGKYVPPPAGVKPPSLWGTEERLRALFGDGITMLTTARRTFCFRYHSAQHWLDVFRTYYGPVHKTFGALDPERQEALATDLIDLLNRLDIGEGNGLVVPSEYLEVVATRS